MSAPKPRVSRTVTFIWQPGKAAMAHRWTWTCGCGASDPSPYGLVLHRLAMDGAIEHSRTHTAERVADRLDEWAGKRTDSRAGGAYWEGYLEGAALAQRDAADFIRKHLVGGAS
ncbi:hypothetical protein ABH936_001922 [Dermacoccus sp. GAS27A]